MEAREGRGARGRHEEKDLTSPKKNEHERRGGEGQSEGREEAKRKGSKQAPTQERGRSKRKEMVRETPKCTRAAGGEKS